jgi:ankyrin repeat protein
MRGFVRITAGADVNATDIWGNTALHNTVYNGENPRKAQILIEAGAKNLRNKAGELPIDIVIKRKLRLDPKF